jgi:hypothetical protein
MRRLCSAIGTVVLLDPLAGQSVTKTWDSSAVLSVEALVDEARAGTGKYHDQSAAILDGYRPIGRDFPAMAQHWIHVGLLFDETLDPARPEVLTYVVVAGQPRLLGVAYALPLLAGEEAPTWPAGVHLWHDHFRTIADETVLPQHHQTSSPGAAARISMLHAWIWSPNPDGMFAADNWTIPYLRLGMPPPSTGSPSTVAKALSLVTGGDDYFLQCVEASAPLTASERSRVAAVFAHARAVVDAELRNRDNGELTRANVGTLANAWASLWSSIDRSVRSSTRRQLQHLPVR